MIPFPPGKIPWRRERLPIPVFLPGEFHELYSPWGQIKHFSHRFFQDVKICDDLSPIFVFDSVSCGHPLPNQDVENDSPEPSDWDRFAAEEYETLVAEESAQAQFQEG